MCKGSISIHYQQKQYGYIGNNFNIKLIGNEI